ncbi:trwN protein [Bartonella phoceensis]|uniref:trwN protein n=1 Tax=Bartonella phoceensis TaxID=270249 RepID=UPI001ABA2A77|nr:trwN protein [Bartonella phoceensis]
MTVPNFVMFTVVYVSAVYFVLSSVSVMQGAQDDVHTVGVNNDHGLLHQASISKEAGVIANLFKQSSHNFDVKLRRIGVENMQQFGISFSDMFDPCKSLKMVRTALSRCYEQIASGYDFEQAALQNVVDFYNAGNSESGFSAAYMRRVISRIRVKNPKDSVILEGESQDTLKLRTGESRPEIEIESLSTSPEELVDVFMHKASGVHDAFTTESASSLGKQQE